MTSEMINLMDISLPLENEVMYLIGLGLLIVILAGLLYFSWKNRQSTSK